MSYIYSIPQTTPKRAIEAQHQTSGSVFQEFERKIVPATKSAVYNPEVQNNRRRLTALKIGVVTLIVGAVVSLASRRVRFNLVKMLQTLRTKNEEILTRTSEAIASKEAPFVLRAKIGIMRVVRRVSDSFLNILGNVDHYKNRLSGQVTDNIPVVSRAVRWVNGKLTPLFTGTVKGASVDKFKAAEQAAIKLKDTLNDLALRNPELRNVIGNNADDLLAAVRKLSSDQALKGRHDELSKLLKEAVSEYNAQIDGMFRKTNVAKSAERLIDGTISIDIAKNRLLPSHLKLLDLKRAVSFQHKEKVKVIDDLLELMTVTKGVKPDAALIKKLTDARSVYAKTASSADAQSLLSVLDDIAAKVDHPKLTRALTEVRAAVSTTRSGQLQQMVKVVDEALAQGQINKETHKALQKQLSQLHNKVSGAVEFEKTNLSGRLLDIAIGPVPLMETTGLVVPVAALVNEIAESENHKERVSKALVYAPTIAGGVGATVFALRKGIFGANALLFGLGTGWLFNRFGTYVDQKYYSKGREFNTLKILTSDPATNPGVKIFEV